MATLLRIDSSPRIDGSHSRELADFCHDVWQRTFPDDNIIIRDIGLQAVPHINNDTVISFQTTAQNHDDKMRRASAHSEQLIAEILSADVLLISVPMYNFSIPSVLKAYIDQITRMGFSFNYDSEKGFYGLLQNKSAVVCIAAGAPMSDPSMEALDHLQPYLRTLLKFIGIEQIEMVMIEATNADPQRMYSSKTQAQATIHQLIQCRHNQSLTTKEIQA